MKIAFDSQIFYDQRYGGVSRYFNELVRELDQMGESVRIFSPLYQNAYLQELRAGLVEGLAIPHLPHRIQRAVGNINRVVCGGRIGSWKPSLIHETFYTDKPAGPRDIPRVVTVYDMIHELFPNAFYSYDTTAKRKLSAVRRASQVICISESTRRDLLALVDIPPEKVSVVHLGFDVLKSTAPTSPLPGRPFLLYVGQRGSYKNFASLLDAYASSPSLRSELDLVAFGGGPFSQAEMDFIRSAGLEKESVRQVSGTDGDLAAHYQAARVFVYPSSYEGFGLPPLEAMALGCVVASSNASSMPEVLGDAAEYFNPTDVDTIRETIERVSFDEARRTELLAKGATRLKNFSWKKCAAETLEAYRRAIG